MLVTFVGIHFVLKRKLLKFKKKPLKKNRLVEKVWLLAINWYINSSKHSAVGCLILILNLL